MTTTKPQNPELWPATIECLGVKIPATFPVDHLVFQNYVHVVNGVSMIRIVAHTKDTWYGYAKVHGVEVPSTGDDGLALGSAEEVVRVLEARVRTHLEWGMHLKRWDVDTWDGS